MTYFYWTMAVLTISTFVPSALYVVLYAATGEEGCMRRARMLWGFAKLFGLIGFNVGIWGHVLVALWEMVVR
jgi:hypothetical protein